MGEQPSIRDLRGVETRYSEKMRLKYGTDWKRRQLLSEAVHSGLLAKAIEDRTSQVYGMYKVPSGE